MLRTALIEVGDYLLDAEFEFDPGTSDHLGPTPESSYVGDDYHFVLLSLYTTIAGHDVDLMDINDILDNRFITKAEAACIEAAFNQLKEESYP